MVKVITERPARPISDVESVTGVDDGDDGTDWEPDTTTGLPPGNDPGDVLTWDGDSWEPESPGGGTVITPGTITDNTSGSAQTVIDDATWNEFPGLIRLDDDRVLVVYRGNGTDHHTDGQLCGQIGTLNGTRDAVSSWSSRFTILDDAEDLRCEDGVTVIDDQIIVAFRYFDGADNHDPSLLICDDNPAAFTSGSTWGSPIAMPDPGGSVQEYTQGRVHELDDGSFMLGGGYDSGGNHTVGVWLWSGTVDDPSGATFVDIGTGSGDFQEISVGQLDDGSCLALLRRGATSETYFSTSSDNGASWSTPASSHDGFGYPMWRQLLSGLFLTVYRDSPNGDTAWRTSSDGLTWGSETILDTTGTRNAYATLLQTTNHDILCVYGVEYSFDGSTGTADLFGQWFYDSSTFSDDSAPTDVDYLIGTASASLPDAIVVGTTPGGELGGTWASPTVDSVHSGSAHLALGTTAGTAAEGDHTHAGSGGGTPPPILLASDHATPFTFDHILQNSEGTDFLWASE